MNRSFNKRVFYAFFNTIIPDIKSLNYKVWIILFFALLISLFTTCFQFSTHSFGFPSWILNNNKSLFSKLFYLSQIPATVLAIYQLFLITYAKQSAWFWGILYWILTATTAIVFGYGGSAEVDIFFVLPFQFLAHYWWYLRSFKLKSQKLIISKMTFFWWMIFLWIAIVFTILFYFQIPEFTKLINGTYAYTNKPLPRLLDTLNSSLTIIGCICTILFFKENWIFWILTVIFQLILYSGVGQTLDINMVLTLVMFFIYDLYGLWKWYDKSVEVIPYLLKKDLSTKQINKKIYKRF